MPALPTLAQTFRDAGYKQPTPVGKLHVYPQRSRIGFDDVILDEEGRTQYGVIDDYEMFLGDRGFPGRQFDHGMSNNDYNTRPWPLPEDTHATNWATAQMVRAIKRRERGKPAFWFLSYRHPAPAPRAAPSLSRHVCRRRRRRAVQRRMGVRRVALLAAGGPRPRRAHDAASDPRRAASVLCVCVPISTISFASWSARCARKTCSTTRSSASPPTTATCSAITACGPRSCSTSRRRTFR